MWGTNMTGADLEGADGLEGTDLEGADRPGADPTPALRKSATIFGARGLSIRPRSRTALSSSFDKGR